MPIDHTRVWLKTPDNTFFIIKPRHKSVFYVGEKLNSKFLIQPSDTLLVELTETHKTMNGLERMR